MNWHEIGAIAALVAAGCELLLFIIVALLVYSRWHR